MSKEFAAAKAFLRFRKAYEDLVAVAAELPEIDVSEGYPFYLLDFEAIQPSVSDWCSRCAAMLLREVPDRVENPACLGCKHFGLGAGPNGLCKGNPLCPNFTVITFSREEVMPALKQYGIEVTSEASDRDVLISYLNLLEVCHAKEMEYAEHL